MHKNLEDTNLLNQEVTHWERHNYHLQVLLDQKDSFLHDLLNKTNHTLLHNFLKDAQYWNDRHVRLAQFVVHTLEDLPGLLNEAYDVLFPYDTLWVVFHFISFCRVVFKRFHDDHVVAC